MNQITIGAIMAESKGNPVLNEDLIRHMVINNLRLFKNKHSKDYGNPVVCYDGMNSWRKSVFEYYKKSRKDQRQKSKVDWTELFRILNKIKTEIKENLPYKVMCLDNCESDDLIAVLTKNYHHKENIMIISSDGDFQQLQKYPNVQQYSPIHKKVITSNNPEEYLFEHILKGDSSDGIPNILSQDDIFCIDGKRQTSMTAKKYEEYRKLWIESSKHGFLDITHITTDPVVLKNINRNITLIDFDSIPENIQNTILDTYENTTAADKSKILPYFMKNGMKNMLEHASEF